jgi:YVTN family beta-propeller protein
MRREQRIGRLALVAYSVLGLATVVRAADTTSHEHMHGRPHAAEPALAYVEQGPVTLPAVSNPHEAGTSPLGHYPERVYVPNTVANTVQVIDPKTFRVIATYKTATEPHHITPSWDLTRLYVNNTKGNALTVIDPSTAKIVGVVPVLDPYNLYFTPDGKYAIVVAERYERLDFRDPKTWTLVKSVPIPQPGVDHMAFSRDGSYLVTSTEYSGTLIKVDLARLEVAATMKVGGLPIDVVRVPGSNLMYVANQKKNGVHVIDPDLWKEITFIPTGKGTHGILLSHDRKSLYVSNRLGGSISIIDVASKKVVNKWNIGGSPDMGQLSPDGKQFWITGRYHGEVAVIDTTSGQVIRSIHTDAGPHGLTYFPTSAAAHSVGHNGIYLED